MSHSIFETGQGNNKFEAEYIHVGKRCGKKLLQRFTSCLDSQSVRNLKKTLITLFASVSVQLQKHMQCLCRCSDMFTPPYGGGVNTPLVER